MPTQEAMLPQTLSFEDLVHAGGGIPDRSQPVTFKSHQWNAPPPFAKDPMSAPPEFEKEIRAQYEMISHSAEFDFALNDVRVCTTRVLRSTEGGISRSVKSGFKPPSEITIDVGYDRETGKMQTMTVPDDWQSIPTLPDALCRVVQFAIRGPVCVEFQYHRTHQAAIEGFIKYINTELKERSIYRGQIFDINFNYLDATGVDPSKIVFSREVGGLLNTWALGIIRYPDIMEEAGLKTKVSTCLAGAPGIGKTEFIRLAQAAVYEQGGTGVVVPPGSDIAAWEYAMKLLRKYQEVGKTSALFGEDIEKLGEDRARALEAFDGATSKNDRVLLLTTTNFPEQMEPAMLRPGRIDQLIQIGLPDVEAFGKLVTIQLGDLLAEDVDFDDAFPHFEGYAPAWIVGAGQSIVRSVIARTGAVPEDGSVSTLDLINAAEGYRPQFEMQRLAYDRPEVLGSIDGILRETILRQVEAAIVDMNVSIGDPTSYVAISSIVEEKVDERIKGRMDRARIVKTDDGNVIRVA